MARRLDAFTGVPQLAMRYFKVPLPIDTWVSLAVPDGIDVMETQSNTIVVVQAAVSDVVPSVAPAGVGSIVPQIFEIEPGTTHLHFYGLEGVADVIYINGYTG